MIAFISDIIFRFTSKHVDMAKYGGDIHRYGIEIMVSTFFNIILIILFGLLLNAVETSVLFLLVFIVLRQYTGGFHADTYLKCNLAFLSCYLLVYTASTIDTTIGAFAFIAALSICFAIVCLLSPIKNKHKILTEAQKRKYRKNAICILGVIYILLVPIYKISMLYFKFIFFTIISVVMLMIIGVLLQRKKEVTK